MTAQNWRFMLTAPNDLAQLEIQWRKLEKDSTHSLFLTWSWLGPWLSMIPPEKRPQVLQGHKQGKIQLLALLSQPFWVWKTGIPHRRRAFGISGNDLYDSFYIEHNGMLICRGQEDDGFIAALNWLRLNLSDWDGLYFPGIITGSVNFGDIHHVTVRNWDVVKSQPAYAVELPSENLSLSNSLALLKPRVRNQLKQTISYFGGLDALTIETASTVDEAIEYFNQLVEFHQRRWMQKKQSGAFYHSSMRALHENVIRNSLCAGFVRLRRVLASGKVIGYVYNFCLNKIEFNYQGGFYYSIGSAHRAGLLTHFLAMREAQKEGSIRYDLLAGDNQMKRSLSNVSYSIEWLEMRQDQIRCHIERACQVIRSNCINVAGRI